MGYNVDFKRITVFRHMNTLKNQNLLPGRKMLLENIDENFQRMADAGINDLAELKSKMFSNRFCHTPITMGSHRTSKTGLMGRIKIW